jgi:two-component system, LuxR family, sensor kinase FixL
VEQTQRSGEIIRRLRSFVGRGETTQQPETVAKLMEEASALALVGMKERGVTVRLLLDPMLRTGSGAAGLAQPAAQRGRRHGDERAARTDPARGALGSHGSDQRRRHGQRDPPAMEAQLFQPFVTTKRDRIGIGLSVCRAIVEAHAGRLWVEPNNCGGSVFRFTLRSVDETPSPA